LVTGEVSYASEGGLCDFSGGGGGVNYSMTKEWTGHLYGGCVVSSITATITLATGKTVDATQYTTPPGGKDPGSEFYVIFSNGRYEVTSSILVSSIVSVSTALSLILHASDATCHIIRK
jgi:hypothetical protein